MILEYQNVKKMYGQKEALKGVSFCIETGVCGLLGSNGAGKSTLINITVGNLKEDAGSILIDGKKINPVSQEFHSIIGYVPQEQALYPDFTIKNFLNYMAVLRGISKRKITHRVQEVIKQVELCGMEQKKIRTLSGGMKQRLMIAQAILDDPKILILDEPTSGLDPKQRMVIRNLVSQIATRKIVIFATHVVPDIEYIANDILLLKEGEVLRHGSPAELLKEVQDKVFELTIEEKDLSDISEQYMVSHIQRGENGLHIRILADKPPQNVQARQIRVELEDVYLWHFGEKNGINWV